MELQNNYESSHYLPILKLKQLMNFLDRSESTLFKNELKKIILKKLHMFIVEKN